MISVHEAQQEILKAVNLRPPILVTLQEALGRFISERILAPFDSPSFDNSAMDGYALRAADVQEAGLENPVFLAVTATLSAGVNPQRKLQGGEAMRIFTGAMLPQGSDAVVKQEDISRSDHRIQLTRPVPEGENIRRRGEELKKEAEIFPPGTLLNPAAIGLMASFGFDKVPVYSPPRVGILVTGSEITASTAELEPGQIYDSNSFAIQAALHELYIQPAFISHCRDQREALGRALADGLEKADLLIVTGGVSVGDFDFVKEASQTTGIQEIFWKVRQKPGKPLFFGKKDPDRLLFGLPGNPASALVCFYEFVRPALLHSMGAIFPFLPSLDVPVADIYQKKSGLVHFLKGLLTKGREGPQVEILEQQGSHLLRSFAQANCLVVLSEDCEWVEKGERVRVHLLPTPFICSEGGVG